MFSFIVDLIKWISKKENRKVLFKYYRQGEEVVRKSKALINDIRFDKYTVNSEGNLAKDGLKHVAKKLKESSRTLPDEVKKELAKQIQEEKKGILKNLNVDIDLKNKEYKAGIGS